MAARNLHMAEPRLAGYAALVTQFHLEVIPNWHKSFVASGNSHRVEMAGGMIEEVYPARYWPGDRLSDQLEFALKYDGTNLAILASIFEVAPRREIKDYIVSKPRGKYARRLWFLYEMLTSSRLPLKDLQTGGYIDLLEPDEYYPPPRQTRSDASESTTTCSETDASVQQSVAAKFCALLRVPIYLTSAKRWLRTTRRSC